VRNKPKGRKKKKNPTPRKEKKRQGKGGEKRKGEHKKENKKWGIISLPRHFLLLHTRQPSSDLLSIVGRRGEEGIERWVGGVGVGGGGGRERPSADFTEVNLFPSSSVAMPISFPKGERKKGGRETASCRHHPPA